MGIFGAMSTAITGLQAQAYSLERISDNIANSQTTGYKRSDTSFVDFVADSPANRQALGVVNAFSRPTNTLQGDIANVQIPTYMAINGDGYFIVTRPTATVDGQPVLGGGDLYTRRGDFEFNENGFLVNGSGYYLKGLPIDPVTGNPSGGIPEVINISNDFLPASATTAITYRANLASYPKTASADPAVPGSELIDPADYNDADPIVAGTVSANDSQTFVEQSIAGGAISAFDSLGAAVNVQFRWAKTDSAEQGGSDTWNLFYLTNSNATGAQTAWQNIGTDYVFGADGRLSPSIASTTISGLTVNGINLGDIVLNHGSNGLTQFADDNGVVKLNDLSQNGFAAGEFVGVSISREGRLVGSYTNGRSLDLAEVTLASFNGDNGLAKVDGGAFRATPESGEPIVGALGFVQGSALEGSNTDIADEFTKLIVTQQAYAANTRIISTSDEMVREALNMIR